jgi:hypothetical protein
LPHNKRIRSGQWPWRAQPRRVGADAAFAKALARSEFGRFYTDDREQREVARSLARAKGKSAAHSSPPPEPPKVDPPGDRHAEKRRVTLWREPRVRERRTELANAKMRLLESGKRQDK